MSVDITKKGAIRLGRHVACDAHDKARPIRVVTHAHSDHMIGLPESARECDAILATEQTIRLIKILKGKRSLGGKEKPLKYGEPLNYRNNRITLFPTDHILGSAQVLVETEGGGRTLYTSDFRFSKTPVVGCDVLVIDSTYGNPKNVRPFEDEVEQMFVLLVEHGLRYGPVYIFGYHGKIQEAMRIIHEAHVDAPLIAPRNIMNVCGVYRDFGEDLGKLICSLSDEGREITRSRQPYVAFYHVGARRYVRKDAMKLYLIGWEFLAPYRQIGDFEYIVALSDHSDFDGLIQYVRESGPKLVITDDYRVGDAVRLAREIESRVGIRAIPMP